MLERDRFEKAAGGIKVTCNVADNVNVAFYQNAVPIIRELAIENDEGRDLIEISVHLSSEPAFVNPGVWRIDRIADQATHHIRSLDPCGWLVSDVSSWNDGAIFLTTV
jgi:hypothetical protein